MLLLQLVQRLGVPDHPRPLSAPPSNVAARFNGIPESARRPEATEALAVCVIDRYGGTASVEVPEPAMGADVPRADAEEINAEIVFEIDSSALPQCGRGRLRDVAAMLESTDGHVVELGAAVNENEVRGTSPLEARRYNRWLGRMERIGEWLRREVRTPLTIVPAFLGGDPTEQVVIKVRQRS